MFISQGWKNCCYDRYVAVYSSINRCWVHNSCKNQTGFALLPGTPAARSPTPSGTALSWKGEPPSGCGWGVGASDGSRPTEPSHTWPGRRGAHAMQPAAAMLPSIPQSPRFTGLKHRAGKELAAFVLPRVSMTAVPLTLSSFSRGERSSAILAWTWSENCL